MHPCKIQAHKQNVSKGSGEKKKMETGCNHCVGLDQQQAQRLKFMNTEFLDTTAEEPADN